MCAANDENKVSDGAIGRQLLGSYSSSTHLRMLRKAGIKRKRFDTQDLGQFSIVDDEKKRWNYTDADIEGVRNYMVDNTYPQDSPMKDDTIYKKDYNGEYLLLSYLKLVIFVTGSNHVKLTIPLHTDDIILDDNGKKVEIQRMLITACPRQLHVHMMEDETQGGYKHARDDSGVVKFFLSTIVIY